MITFASRLLNKNASLENQFHDGVDRVFPGHRAKIQTQLEIERSPYRYPCISLLCVVGYDTAAK